MKMSLEHRFIFSENVLLRCKCVKSEYVPIEMVDFDDIIARLERMVQEMKEAHRRHSTSEGRRSSLMGRLFEHRRSSVSSPPPTISNPFNNESYLRPPVTRDNNFNPDSIVLQMSPLMRNNRKSKKLLKQISNDRLLNEDLMPSPPPSPIKGQEVKESCQIEGEQKQDILDCLNDSPADFVHVISYTSVRAAEHCLRDLYNTQKTIVVEIDVVGHNSISISYQKLLDFKFDFMMVDLSRKTDFMLFLKPF